MSQMTRSSKHSGSKGIEKVSAYPGDRMSGILASFGEHGAVQFVGLVVGRRQWPASGMWVAPRGDSGVVPHRGDPVDRCGAVVPR